MKHTPIIVRVPGDNSNELWLTPSEAKKLQASLQKYLKTWDDMVKKIGAKAARKFMAECRRKKL